MADLIEPRTLRGFRDYPPGLMLPRERMLEQARRVYSNYGYSPIDTPALEYAEILLGKGGAESDKLIYRFTDHGGRDVALRFDLTVPFARFAAQHIPQLGTPFKRYHMGPVWRGENTGQGRYREFWQCDFDTIGTTSNAADIEVVFVIHDLFKALGFDRFSIHVNNRMLLNGMLEEMGLEAQATAVLRALDKLAKIGAGAVQDELRAAANMNRQQAEHLLRFAQVQRPGLDVLDELANRSNVSAATAQGISRLREMFVVAAACGVGQPHLTLDLSIARGLDYYTGTIYETFLTDLPEIGSVCSGGRYDNLAGLYTKQQLPGVGASLGLDRLLTAMEKLGMLPVEQTPAPILIVQFTPERLSDYMKMARLLQSEGLGACVFPDPKKIGQQLQYAERRGFRVALIAGPDEFALDVWKIKDLRRRRESSAAVGHVVSSVRAILNQTG